MLTTGTRRAVVGLLLLGALCPLAARQRVVTAYTLRTPTATGSAPVQGTCAGPSAWLRQWVHIERYGWYRITDVHPGGGLDLWVPSHRRARAFGRQLLTVRGPFPRKGR